jgi:16S rRNA (guanine527-N7)-methyltransferase
VNTLTLEQQSYLENYIALLQKWNKAYNLTAIDTNEAIQTKHIDDSLAIGPFLHGENIIDIGTGAGLPGIPLAIILPDKHFTLLDSNGKKIRFLKQAIQQLGLKNVEAVHSRVEDYQPPESCFSSVISRAFASIYDMLQLSKHLVCADGRFLAMKGVQPNKELQQLPAGFALECIHNLTVAGLDAERCLVEIKLTNE